MFNRLKKSLDDALRKLEDAFGAGPEEEIDDLLRAMRSELIQTKASPRPKRSAMRKP